MFNRASESFLADIREHVEIPNSSSGRRCCALVDLTKVADLPHGAFAAYMREYQCCGGYGLPVIPAELEKPLAALLAEIPATTEYQSYLEQCIANLNDGNGSDAVIAEAFEEFEQRMRDHAAGLRMPGSDWADWCERTTEELDGEDYD